MRLAISIFVAFLCANWSLAQEWVERDGVEYNCDVIIAIISDYGEVDLVRSSGLVSSVNDFFGSLFPVCPSPDVEVASDAEIVTRAEGTDDRLLYSFTSEEEGLRPVLGPLSLPAGIYVATLTTEESMSVSRTSLSGDCGSDLEESLFNLACGRGAVGAQSVVIVEKDCEILLEVDNVMFGFGTMEDWVMEIVSVDSSEIETVNAIYSVSSAEVGLQPALGPLLLAEGVYVFSVETTGYLILSPKSLSGDCGFDLKASIFNLSAGQAAEGAQSVVDAEKDCDVFLEVGNASDDWTLDIRRLS